MNYLPRQAAIVARNPSEADFAEAAITSNGLQVRRFTSTDTLVQQLHSANGSATDSGAGGPDVAILIGSTAELTKSSNGDIGEIAQVIPVVVTSATATVSDAVELMKHGATDVVELPCDRHELWDRIQSAIERSESDSACKARMAELRSRVDTLTSGEREVVDAMLDGLANKQIAQRLGIGLRTVELRRSKVMRKMHAKSVAELVKFICMSGTLRGQQQAVEA